MKNILFIFLLINFFSVQNSYSQTIRSTSFENRGICEKDNGVWREFGNGCTDGCAAKVDKYTICTMALTYSCDCGKGRCWEAGTCFSIRDYKKVYSEKQAKNEARLNRLKKARKKEFERNKLSIMNRLSKKSGGKSKSAKNRKKSKHKPVKPAKGPVTNFIVNDDIVENNLPIEKVAPVKQKFKIPSFFLKKQEIDKKNREKDALAKSQKKEEIKDTATESLIKSKIIEGLPQIPLPN